MTCLKLTRTMTLRILDWRAAHRAWCAHKRECAALGVTPIYPRATFCEVWVGWMIADHRDRTGALPLHWM